MMDRNGNLPSLPGLYPDAAAPIVRNSAAGSRTRHGALGHAVVASGKSARSRADFFGVLTTTPNAEVGAIHLARRS